MKQEPNKTSNSKHNGQVTGKKTPPRGYEIEDMQRRVDWLAQQTGHRIGEFNLEEPANYKGLTENQIGYIGMPLSIAGPLKIEGTYANGDCTGDLTAGITTDATITLNTDGTYTTDVGTGPGENDSGTWSSTATTLTINYFGGFLPYTYTVETTDGVTTMYNNQEAETGLGAMCTKSVYTLQAS